MVPKIGVEPTLRLRKRILSPPRLPFRHFGNKEPTHSIVRELQVSLKLILNIAQHRRGKTPSPFRRGQL